MSQKQKTSIISISILIFLCYGFNFAFSYNENKIGNSVIETLTAIPSATLIPTRIPSPTSATPLPPVPPTLLPAATPIRTDLIGSSLDYVVREMEKKGFEFNTDHAEIADGYGTVYGSYRYNRRIIVSLYEEGYSLVNASYRFFSLGATEDEINLYHPGSEVLIRLIVGDQAYTDIIEPWESILRPLDDHSVLCFDGYVYGHRMDTFIRLKQYYPNEICG